MNASSAPWSSTPSLHRPISIGTAEQTRIDPNPNVGPRISQHGASSGLHHDHHDNLYVLLRGRKRFRLWSPAEHKRMYLHGTVDAVHPNGRIVYKGQVRMSHISRPRHYCPSVRSAGRHPCVRHSNEFRYALCQCGVVCQSGDTALSARVARPARSIRRIIRVPPSFMGSSRRLISC